MEGERTVAGITCGEVLADLSEFLDGELDGARAGQLKAHVEGCDLCERFGADFAVAVGALRGLGEAAPVADDVAERLRLAIADL